MDDTTAEPINDGNHVGRTPRWVSCYHAAVILLAIAVAFLLHHQWVSQDELRKQYYALIFGCLGGAVTASRYVVHAVRHGEYDRRRLLWQILTPVYSAVLAWMGVITIRGGLLTLSTAPTTAEPQYTYFIMGFSFLVGFGTESFVKRLIMAAESLFGERGDLDADQRKLPGGKAKT